MDLYEVEVFQQTSDFTELRFSAGGTTGAQGLPRTRGLDRSVVEALLQAAGTTYGEDSPARRVVQSAQLRELGEQLFVFLDGDERWLSAAAVPADGATVRITAAERLRHLPWELLTVDGNFQAVSATRPWLPVRAVGTGGSDVLPVANRPLRVLFMATSPEEVEPELNFEAEEAKILQATTAAGVELVVEESGTLEGLRFTIGAYEPGYFDVLHITGHASVTPSGAQGGAGRPVFVMEDEFGSRADVGTDEIAQALVGQWPRLVFVSGCLTGSAPDGGTVPSMSEALVQAGAPAVLGWALPVGDVSATLFAARLYEELSAGQRLDRAVQVARRTLFKEEFAAWHLLRMYADRTPLSAMVTALNTPAREPIPVRHAADEFLDPQNPTSRVATREAFVGRRRVIQRCLRVLKASTGTTTPAQHALVLQGMGGLGKSTLASRLLERMPTHRRVVWFGRVDEIKLRELPDKVAFAAADREQYKEATAILADESMPLTARLRFLLNGPLARVPCLFVFDDFEQGNLDERPDGTRVLAPDMAVILPALLTAIQETGSRSRVIITSRYQFPTPPGTRIHVECLESLTRLEQTKKIANLENLRPGAPTDKGVRERAVLAAAGNPRLLDWLNLIVRDADLDVSTLLVAIEAESDRFREDVLAQKLLASQPDDLQKMLARLNAIELPVPAATVHAVHASPDTSQHMKRAAELGLLEAGTDPTTGEGRYYVSNVLRPLLRPLLTDEEHTSACAAAAESLYELWVVQPTS